jgi:hypothetical protein
MERTDSGERMTVESKPATRRSSWLAEAKASMRSSGNSRGSIKVMTGKILGDEQASASDQSGGSLSSKKEEAPSKNGGKDGGGASSKNGGKDGSLKDSPSAGPVASTDDSFLSVIDGGGTDADLLGDSFARDFTRALSHVTEAAQEEEVESANHSARGRGSGGGEGSMGGSRPVSVGDLDIDLHPGVDKSMMGSTQPISAAQGSDSTLNPRPQALNPKP